MKRNFPPLSILTIVSLAFILSACSLAEDVTPPPGTQTSADIAITSTPQVEANPTSQAGQTLGAAPANAQGTPQSTQTGGNPQLNAGSINGVITNGSGGPLPDGLLVTLHGYDSMQETYTKSTTAGADGKYAFPLVEMPSGRSFLVTVSYQNVDYSSELSTSPQAGQTISLPVSVYDPTSDSSALSIDRMHIFFDTSKPDVVEIVELFVITNSGKQAVTPAKAGQPIVEFPLPEGATNVQIQDGMLGSDRYVKTDTGFGDTLTIPPGSGIRQVLYGFDLPYKKPFMMSQPVNLTIASAILMAPKGGKLTSPTALTDGGDRDTEGMSFHIYSAANLAAGSQLALTLVADSSAASSNLWFSLTPTFYIGLGALILVLGVGAYWFFRQRQQKHLGAIETVSTTSPAGEDVVYDSTDAIIDAIAALDDLHQSGKLDETAYQQRRSELKLLLAGRMKSEND